MSASGKAITARFGTSSFTVVALHTGELVLHQQRRGPDGAKRTVKNRLSATDEPVCVHRLLDEPREIEAVQDEGSLLGQWTGTWETGNIIELEVDAIDSENLATGRVCARNVETGRISIWDLHDRTALSRSYDPEARALTVDRHAQGGRLHRKVFTEGDDATVHYETIGDVGTTREERETLELRRGAHPDGCLRFIAPLAKES